MPKVEMRALGGVFARVPAEHGIDNARSSDGRQAVVGIGVSAVAALLFLLQLLATPGIPGGDDGYRHARIAWLMIRDFKAVLSDPWHLVYFWPKPVDAWFGYHVLLAPLTLFLPPIIAAKVLAAAVFGGIAYVCHRILTLTQVVWPFGWLILLLAGSAISLHRAMLSRPFLMSILLVLAAALSTLEKKPLRVGIAAAVHASCYSMFFLAALAPVVQLLLRRDRDSFRLVIASLVGMVLGLMCSPYFPENAIFEFWVVVGPAALGGANKVNVGGELRPLTVWWLVASIPVMAAWFIGMVLFLRNRAHKVMREPAALFLAISLVTLAGSIRVGRTFDYFVPFAVLFAAIAISPWMADHRKDAKYIGFVLLFLCAVNIAMNAINIRETISPDRFRNAAEYLRQHAGNRVVVNSKWEEYPFLYFWNPAGKYLVGIEPTFMLLEDAAKYWLWRHASDDETTTCPAEHCTAANRRTVPNTLAGELGAGYVLVEREQNPQLGRLLASSPLFTEVYQDAVCRVFVSKKAI